MKSRPSRAFSLVELLVASAVLLILLLALLSLTNSTVSFTGLAQRKMDSGASLRAAMDRMTEDISTAVLRDDLPPFFLRSTTADGSDEFYLYSQAEGYGGDRGLTVIGYRIRNGKLERAAQGTGWTTNRAQFLETLGTNTVHAANYDVVGDKVFRLKVEFLGASGLITQAPTNWNQVSAIVLNLAAADDKARQLAQSSSLAELLPGTASDPQAGILPDWKRTLEDPDFFSGGNGPSPEAKRGIEVRRRVVPLPK